MKTKTVNIVIALIVAFLASAGLFMYVKSLQDRAIAGEQVQEVYVAVETVSEGASFGDVVASGKVKLEKVPARFVAEGAVQASSDSFRDMVLQEKVVKGEQVTASALEPVSEASLSLQVPPGHMAMSISVTDVNSLGSRVEEGDLVAIFATFSKDSVAVPVSKQVLSSVPVLTTDYVAVGGKGFAKSGAGEGKALITVALTPVQAEKLAYVESLGDLYVALQRSGERLNVQTAGVNGASVVK